MTQIKNLTPHPIHLLDTDNKILRTFESEGLVRLKSNTVSAGFTVDECPITRTEFGNPEGLPDQVLNDYYFIVSQLVKSALPERKDLIVPAEVVRDDKGNIIGCKSFGI
jgi:hypothetical protein